MIVEYQMQTQNSKPKTRSCKGNVVIISGPSGVGKSTICKEVVNRLDNIYVSVSVTTRPMSRSEADGRDYRFISKEQFQEDIDKDLLLEYAEVFGHLYGTPKRNVDEAIETGKIIILEIDVQGAKQVKQIYPDALMIFILPPAKDELVKRLNIRAREEDEAKEKRLNKADAEIAAARQLYDHMVVNDDLEEAISQVMEIIRDSQAG